MKPVSRMTSRMSVKGTRGKEFHRLLPSAHLTFLFAGKRAAADTSVALRAARKERRFMDPSYVKTNNHKVTKDTKGARAHLNLFVFFVTLWLFDPAVSGSRSLH